MTIKTSPRSLVNRSRQVCKNLPTSGSSWEFDQALTPVPTPKASRHVLTSATLHE